jgi:hypothetical protein
MCVLKESKVYRGVDAGRRVRRGSAQQGCQDVRGKEREGWYSTGVGRVLTSVCRTS